ncbi:serine/threonine protein kinase [Heyndrickxia shackletonii]|uniref:Serine-protein kinase RsbW n=1 Tax=Heyndrickxia shackletonii TaxID=157838 RepID=A0A0Q3TBT4_9BACI|nr:anti-sigma B factor RsbW [Heyndrickxia shackletonii]KQL51041.1 serine/threonine protein kinase [Heyndrickxia shackletonii]MBB2483477.1 anti-sigma B factor RsbW [Bacillus sp. APMAM]NEZ00743.1 anti-sigma B factor RsbW [Heyndrickxia shackletonii]RTZ53102.1 anti-sigma B factor RsbW [Bacillus sp. SAJ1]
MGAFEYIEMKIPAKPEYVGIIRLTLSGIASRMGFDYENIEDLKIAVSEAITNAIQHGYKGSKEGQISITFGIYSDRLEVVVVDSGKSFDFEKVKGMIGPYHERNQTDLLNEGGLGLYLIKSLMDEVEILQNEGVTVVMTKYLEGEQVETDGKIVST